LVESLDKGVPKKSTAKKTVKKTTKKTTKKVAKKAVKKRAKKTSKKTVKKAAKIITSKSFAKLEISSNNIEIRGANQHNLKNLSLDIPHGEFTVITGPSGSGKSSLAFHTLYAEGQRRYVETFSPYVRQFLDRMDKPVVDRINNIPPASSLSQVGEGI